MLPEMSQKAALVLGCDEFNDIVKSPDSSELTLFFSNQASILSLQKPLSPRKIIFTSGHFLCNDFTSKAAIAQACFAPSMFDGGRHLS